MIMVMIDVVMTIMVMFEVVMMIDGMVMIDDYGDGWCYDDD